MDQKTKPEVSLKMYPARKSPRGGDLPDVSGYVTHPRTKREHGARLYTNTAKDSGALYWKGKVEPYARDASPEEKFRANTARRAEEQKARMDGTPLADRTITLPWGGRLEENDIIIFQSKPEFSGKGKTGKNKPDTFGYWNDGGELILTGTHTIENQFTKLPQLIGGTQFPLTNEQRIAMGYAPKPELGQAIDQAPEGFPEMSDADLQQMAKDAADYDRETGEIRDEPGEEPALGVENEGRKSRRARGGR